MDFTKQYKYESDQAIKVDGLHILIIICAMLLAALFVCFLPTISPNEIGVIVDKEGKTHQLKPGVNFLPRVSTFHSNTLYIVPTSTQVYETKTSDYKISVSYKLNQESIMNLIDDIENRRRQLYEELNDEERIARRGILKMLGSPRPDYLAPQLQDCLRTKALSTPYKEYVDTLAKVYIRQALTDALSNISMSEYLNDLRLTEQNDLRENIVNNANKILEPFSISVMDIIIEKTK